MVLYLILQHSKWNFFPRVSHSTQTCGSSSSCSTLQLQQTHMSSFYFFSIPSRFAILNYLLLFHCYGLLAFLFLIWATENLPPLLHCYQKLLSNLLLMSTVLPVPQWVFLVLSSCHEESSFDEFIYWNPWQYWVPTNFRHFHSNCNW